MRDNVPHKSDIEWLKCFGGLLGSGREPPSHRFNAGEKGTFWIGVFALGLVVACSGLVLDKVVPGLAYLRGTMQVAPMLHATGALLMVCAFLGHIYLGTIGMRGAYRAMRTGYVSDGWAREHNELWYPRWPDSRPAQRVVAVRARAQAGMNGSRTRSPRMRILVPVANLAALAALTAGTVSAKLPPPSEDARAKAAEAAAKAAWSDKVAAFQLCKAMDRVAAAYLASARSAGRAASAPVATPPFADPGPFDYAPPAAPAAAASGPAAVAAAETP